MAYNDAPFGFIPIRHRNGAPYNGSGRWYYVPAGDSTALFPGDPVVITSDGANTTLLEVPGAGSFKPGTLPEIARATAGATNAVTGVVVAVGADTRDSTTYRAASTERAVFVCDNPDVIFRVQADDAVAVTSIGLNTNILFTEAGSTSTGRSGAEVDATAAADATYQCKIIGLYNDPENVVNTAGNQVEVVFALHTMLPAGGILGT